MNHIFSLIWNPASQSYCPAPETARSRVKGRHRKLALALAIAAASSGTQATPAGGTVVDGNALISTTGADTVINQTSDAVTINWLDFDIDADESVTFYQPDSNSLALNRVLTGDGTQINGQLSANGRVFVLDANGVLFGQNAQVNVGSLVASTLNLSSADASNNQFTFTGNGTPASVVNLGQITAADGGAVVLLGGQVSNQGVIRARLGNVALAAGNEITLDFAGDGLLNVQVDQGAARALAANGGLIQADGGSVLMTAHASDALLQTVVNNTGVIEAHTLQEQDGKIMLLGGFNGGTVNVSGTLDASAPEGGNGGFIETSGAIVNLNSDLQVTTASVDGQTGTWLIDPTDLDISYVGTNDGTSHLSTQALQNGLASSNVTVQTQAAGAQPGNITVLDPIIWASGNSLTLQAANNIVFNDYLHAPNGGLVLNAGGAISTGAEGHINVAAFTLTNGNWSQIAATLPLFMADDFTLNGGTFTRATGGNGAGSPLQITDIYGLQGLATTPNANVVLVNDIDASGTSGWNGGAGFNPIGTFASQYMGAFDGAGYEIDGLFINRNGQSGVGLFGFIGAAGSVSNVGLTGVDVTGGWTVGGLAGRNYGTVQASYVSGDVTAINNLVGGLVGDNEGGTISNTYSTASVSGGIAVGGLVGDHEVGSITDSYATGSVNGDDSVGGLIGSTGISATTERTYASGAVTGNSDVGGLVGRIITGASVTNSYWDGFATTMGNVGVGSNSNVFTATEVNGNWGAAPDAYSQASYGNLDLINTWFIAEGSSRPMLRAFLDGGNISNLYQLQGMSANLAGNYTLTQNIDASATAASVIAGNGGNYSDVWGGRGFAPVGIAFGEFTGSLDGQDFVIDGLQINRTAQDRVGLFGSADGALLQNLNLVNVNIRGNDGVGGLAGQAFTNAIFIDVSVQGLVDGNNSVGGLVGLFEGGGSSIQSSYADTDISSTGLGAGGLVGTLVNGATISTSYSLGEVRGSFVVGGLVGVTNAGSSITNSFATGLVDASGDKGGGLVGDAANTTFTNTWASGAVTSAGDTGGLLGFDSGANTFNNNYWDSFTTGQAFGASGATPAGITAVSGDWGVENAYNQATYIGFDFTNDWFISEGFSRPMLRAFLNGGNISNLYQLQGMAANLAGNYTLTQHIDASATAASVLAGNGGNYSDIWGGRGFAPVGTLAGSFTGSFDGNGFAINNLAIERGDQDNVGLFGLTSGAASIQSAALLNADILGNNNVGALVGTNGGSVSDSFAIGLIEATTTNAGGLVGNSSGTISGSYANVAVTSAGVSGGLAGFVDGTIDTSYALGSAVGTDRTGGLVGHLSGGTISQSYAFGSASGNIAIGGLAGDASGGATIVDSFWNSDLNVFATAMGNPLSTTGLTTAQFGNLASFAAWGADIDAEGGTGAIWRIYEGHNSPLLRSFLTQIDAIAYDDVQTYDGGAYQGLHQINGTRGNGVRYGNNYAEFLAAFGENGTPYSGPDALGTTDLEYAGTSQGAINAGGYVLTPTELWSTQQAYDIVITDGALTIDPLAVNITVTVNNASKTYGNADPVFSWGITSGSLGVGDTLTGTLTRQAGENVGNYTIFGNPNGDLTSGNYVVTMNNGVFTINPRPITISVADASKMYGDLDPAFSWALTGGTMAFGQTATAAGITRAPGENVGNYAITPNFSGALASGNYAITLSGGVLTISPREIVIDITNLDKLYGNDDPNFTWAVTSGGLVGDDELSGVLSRVAGENVGTYAISGVVDGDLANGNYSYTINNGVLTISPRPLVLTADSLMKIYGSEDPELTWSITGGTLVEGDTLMVSISRADGSNVGTYAISLDASGDATNSNYALTLVDGQLQITPAPLTVTANDVTSYWDLMPAFTASVDGLVNGDTEAGIFGNSLQVLSNLVLPLPGNYILTPMAALIGENYQITYVDGVLNLLSSNPGGNYIEALTSTQLPAREALGRERRANIYEGRSLLDGSEDSIVLQVLDGGVKLDPDTLKALGIIYPEAVLFPVNSAVVSERYFADLRKFVEQLQRYPEVQILVEGHTSSTGSLALNQRLSEKRAEAVAQVLQGMGLEAERIRTENFDYQRPVATNDTEEGRFKNQRTEVVEDPNAQ